MGDISGGVLSGGMSGSVGPDISNQKNPTVSVQLGGIIRKVSPASPTMKRLDRGWQPSGDLFHRDISVIEPETTMFGKLADKKTFPIQSVDAIHEHLLPTDLDANKEGALDTAHPSHPEPSRSETEEAHVVLPEVAPSSPKVDTSRLTLNRETSTLTSYLSHQAPLVELDKSTFQVVFPGSDLAELPAVLRTPSESVRALLTTLEKSISAQQPEETIASLKQQVIEACSQVIQQNFERDKEAIQTDIAQYTVHEAYTQKTMDQMQIDQLDKQIQTLKGDVEQHQRIMGEVQAQDEFLYGAAPPPVKMIERDEAGEVIDHFIAPRMPDKLDKTQEKIGQLEEKINSHRTLIKAWTKELEGFKQARTLAMGRAVLLGHSDKITQSNVKQDLENANHNYKECSRYIKGLKAEEDDLKAQLNDKKQSIKGLKKQRQADYDQHPERKKGADEVTVELKTAMNRNKKIIEEIREQIVFKNNEEIEIAGKILVAKVVSSKRALALTTQKQKIIRSRNRHRRAIKRLKGRNDNLKKKLATHQEAIKVAKMTRSTYVSQLKQYEEQNGSDPVSRLANLEAQKEALKSGRVADAKNKLDSGAQNSAYKEYAETMTKEAFEEAKIQGSEVARLLAPRSL